MTGFGDFIQRARDLRLGFVDLLKWDMMFGHPYAASGQSKEKASFLLDQRDQRPNPKLRVEPQQLCI